MITFRTKLDQTLRRRPSWPIWPAHPLGLRAKFNLFLIPIIAVAIAALVVLDYGHEFQSVMDAHAIHAGSTAAGLPATAPVSAETTPNAVVTRMITLHASAGVLILLTVVLAVNLTLGRFVLRPITRVRAGIERLQRGFRTGQPAAPSRDEVSDVVIAFADLGLTLDAIMLHALHTDRLATLALLSKMINAGLEPEVQRLGAAATRLNQLPDETVQEAAREIAGATASIIATVRGLDRPFSPGAARRG